LEDFVKVRGQVRLANAINFVIQSFLPAVDMAVFRVAGPGGFQHMVAPVAQFIEGRVHSYWEVRGCKPILLKDTSYS
jgi:hypothetical protein